MNSFEQASGNRREYRLKGWVRGLFLLLAIGMAGGAVFFAAKAHAESAGFLEAIMVIFFLGGGLYLAAYALRSRLILDGSRIVVRGVFKEKSADLSEIEGFRTVEARNSSFTQLYLKEGRGKITISQSFESDDDYRAWLQKATDLDARDRDAILAEISQDSELGSTPEERLSALKQAKTLSYIAIAIALAAAIGMNFAPAAYRLPLAILLALVPVAMLLQAQRSPLLYSFFKKKADPRADLAIVLLIAAFGLAFAAAEIEFVSIKPLLILIVPVALAYIAMLYGPATKNNSQAGVVIGVLFVSLPYSFGLAVVANSMADNAKPASYIVPVVGKHTTNGKSTTYYLDLAPWGPLEAQNEISVSSNIYTNTEEGDAVCLTLHPGRLHAAWYQLADCPALPATEPTQ